MSDYDRIKGFAHDSHQYPDLSKLVNTLVSALTGNLSKLDAYLAVRDMLSGLVLADLRGYISSGDEHEWAAAAKEAHERRLKG